ncbi:MAG: YSC84-related protein [Pseudomonadota bacterium]|nr:YSC84-related protein [Pseudomonadota bacterium]
MRKLSTYHLLMLIALPLSNAVAEEKAAEDDAAKYEATIKAFKEAGESGAFFDSAYGYAVFPNIGKGGVGIGGAIGKGRVFRQGAWVGNSSMVQLSIGFQLGGQVYSMMIFLEDERAFNEFTSGNFEFAAQATAVAITAGASAAATTKGSSAGISGGRGTAGTVGAYTKGMATFTIARGGLMYEAALAGMKFNYKPRK